MATRPALKFRELRKILNSFGVTEEPSRGKGSHAMFARVIDGRRFTFPVPTEKEVKPPYVRGCRRRFQLTAEDGVSDEDFYSRK
jgi:predicted RNA binding protein YcfA (HicA-like mRNA interferase family)